jgi:hypothetical protein
MWLKGARDYYITDHDLIGVFPPEAVGQKPGADALAVVLRKHGGGTKAEPVPFRPGTFAERLMRGGLKGVID